MVDWLQLGQTSGSGDTYVLIQAPDNVSMQERTTTLTVSGLSKHVTVNVLQKGFEGEIGVRPTSLVSTNASGTTTLTVTANTPFSLYSKPAWITVTPTGGTSGTTTISARIGSNTGGTRTGDIIWKCNSFSASATTHVTQESADPYFSISPTEINRSNTSGTTMVLISTNGTWDVTSYPAWLSLAPTHGTSASTGFTITFNENPTAANLTGTIVVRHNETGNLYNVDVTQSSAATVGVLDFVYSVTSTTEQTMLIGYRAPSNVMFMEIDGGAIEPATKYHTFSTTGLHNVKLYLSDSQIGDAEFNYTPLVSVTTYNVNILSEESFGFCTQLTSATFNSRITHVNTNWQPGSLGTSNPFLGCSSLTQISGDPSNVILNGKGFVVGNTLHTLVPDYTTDFDSSVLPTGINTLGSGFLGCASSAHPINTITVRGNITSLERLTFDIGGGYATAITFVDSTIQVIPESCFFGCQRIKSVVIPDSVTRVDDDAFTQCFNLTAVTFGSSVQYIGNNINMSYGNNTTFSPIKSITCKSTIAPNIVNYQAGRTSFIILASAPNSGGNKNGTVHYPAGSDYSSWVNSEPFASDGTWTFVGDA